MYTDGICETCSGETDGTGVVVDNDSDDDEVCDDDEIAGCQDETACNYNASATDGGVTCVYTDGICETCSGETDGTGTVIDNDTTTTRCVTTMRSRDAPTQILPSITRMPPMTTDLALWVACGRTRATMMQMPSKTTAVVSLILA